MISPNFWITAAHWGNMTGATVRFLSRHNILHAAVLGAATQIPGTDIALYKLTAPIDPAIAPLALFATDIADHFQTDPGSAAWLPIYYTDQLKNLHIANSPTFPATADVYATASSAYAAWFKEPIGGDSGNALFTVLNGTPIALATQYTQIASPFISAHIPAIQTAILAAGGTIADYPAIYHLAGFHTYTAPPPPFGPPVTAAVTIKPAGGGDYLTVSALFAAIDAGTYGDGNSPVEIVATCSGGDLGPNPGDWTAADLPGIGGIHVTLQAATPVLTLADTNPYVKTAWLPALDGAHGGISKVTIDGLQFGMSTTNGTLGGTANGSSTLTVKNCRAWVSQDIGATTKTLFGMTLGGQGGTVELTNNFAYVTHTQNAAAVIQAFRITANAAANGTGRLWHNALCNNADTVPTTHVKGAAISYPGTLTLDTSYNCFLGSDANTNGFILGTTSGVLLLTGSGNITSDATGTTYSPAGNGHNGLFTAGAWATLGDPTIALGSNLAGIGSVTPVPLDMLGNHRPQQNLVDAGPLELLRP